jgi:hypothetical protein
VSDSNRHSDRKEKIMKIANTINAVIDATASEPETITLEDLAAVHGGSGMVGPQRPGQRPDNHTSSSSEHPFGLAPYSPPLEIPSIPGPQLFDPGISFDPGFSGGDSY